MFQNRLFNIALMLVILIAILGIAFLVIFQLYIKSPSGSEAKAAVHVQTAQEAAASQYLVDKMITNLQDNSIIQVQFGLQADNEKTKAELETRKAQVQDAINTILHSTNEADLKKAGGYERLKQQIAAAVNKLLSKGKVTDVLYVSIVLG